MLIELNGEVLEVRIVNRFSSMQEAIWMPALKAELGRMAARDSYQLARMNPDPSVLWPYKCNALAMSWRRRRSTGNTGFIKEKANKTWRQSCRTMLSQWHKRYGRIHNDQTRWKQWAINKSSNLRKRNEWLANRSGDL